MLESKVSRIQRDIETMARFTATPGLGMTRLSFTEEDKKTREFICSEMEKAGLHVYTDAAGSIFGRREGTQKDAPLVMIGSHFDSVKNGGNFDGPAGIVTALEIARILYENNISTANPIEFVAMIEEEGTRFGAGLYGSRAMTGKVPHSEIESFRDADGVSLGEAMEKFGLDSLKIKDAIRNPEDLKAFIELHIEQGPVLESESLDVGFVSTIVGITRYDIEIEGRADHAGTTPMHMRKDALLASFEVAKAIHDAAYAKGEGTVGTVGKLVVYPGGANIVPGKVFFTVDIRSVEQGNIEDVVKEMKETLEYVSHQMGVSVHMEQKLAIPPVHLADEIRGIFEEEAIGRNIRYRHMVSGAGHDAMIMASLTNVGLIFVPSKDGRSHCPEEWTDYEQLKKGIDIALGAILRLSEANI
ncbi:MAG: Zn-dependent hydrolase [Aminobacterium sp.]|jgi:allantoate deiminase|nr:Zn-dependent hydrolase [Aminobacterium sp.]MDD3426301.1 Zn-dependent hydrolase [Aminobacterium sp.]MDD3706677.1 Zn-dependent hydrolase [Aminobacterium sp.]MDD4228111.1 Zn-dependent hydrolase [Aminobacterium sp.]MDD4550856.1 Zn-dependent hydrolase [Aminobacterium sp.]